MKKILIIILIGIMVTGCQEKNAGKQQNNQIPTADITTYEYCAFISTVKETADNNLILLDSIQYYTGDDARKQYELDNENNSIKFDNTFYIRNQNIDYQQMKVSDDAEIFTQTFFHDEEGNFVINRKINAAEFISFINSEEWLRFNSVPFRVTVRNGLVVGITEIYIP